jgi:hypothetical protein
VGTVFDPFDAYGADGMLANSPVQVMMPFFHPSYAPSVIPYCETVIIRLYKQFHENISFIIEYSLLYRHAVAAEWPSASRHKDHFLPG